MNIQTALLQGVKLLEDGAISVPRLTAEVLLVHALGRERSYLYAHPEEPLSEVAWLHYGRYLHERLKGKPTQYITGRQEFYGREFRVMPDVLIPRPETEHLVEAALVRIRPGDVVLDVGTGSGILAIASRLLGAKLIFACDNDTVATQVARANIERNAQDNVFIFCGSLECVNTAAAGLALGNLTADVIRDLLPDFHRVLMTQGMAIFSGILIEQAEEVRTWIVNAGFIIHEEFTQGEWLALVVEKHGP